jgi:hypothetical protein
MVYQQLMSFLVDPESKSIVDPDLGYVTRDVHVRFCRVKRNILGDCSIFRDFDAAFSVVSVALSNNSFCLAMVYFSSPFVIEWVLPQTEPSILTGALRELKKWWTWGKAALACYRNNYHAIHGRCWNPGIVFFHRCLLF